METITERNRADAAERARGAAAEDGAALRARLDAAQAHETELRDAVWPRPPTYPCSACMLRFRAQCLSCFESLTRVHDFARS